MKKNKSFLLALIITAYAVCPSFAGLFLHNYELSVIKTSYFDIIYPEKSSQSAHILAEHADALMDKACAKLQAKPLFHLPVVITPDNDQLNAYFTPAPYNRIVLYDTPCDEGSLAVFSDTLISVFYHELVHAVSINIKSSFWQAMSDIFTDAAAPSMFINLPTSFIEGVTVSFESADGEGRLNDAQSLHLLIQSKIEGKFPTWQQASGVRDIYPAGAPPYMFGGAFAAFIQQKYGMEKYAEFWSESGRIHFFKLAAGIYKKVYKRDIAEEWKDFYDSIQVPEPVQQHGLYTITDASLTSSLTSAGSSAVWIDTSRAEIMMTSLSAPGTYEKRKLMNCSSQENRVVLSADGSLLVVSSAVPHASGAANTVRLYNINKKSYFAEIKGMRDACHIAGEKQYICGVSTESAFSSLVVYDLNTLKEVRRLAFERTQTPFTPVDAGNGFAAFIVKAAGGRALALYDIERGIMHTYPLKETGIIPRYLSSSSCMSADGSSNTDTMLSFSWTPAVPDASLTRLGFFTVAHADSSSAPNVSYTLQTNDYSGGVFMPAAASLGGKTPSIVYNAEFYTHHSVCAAPISSFTFGPASALACAASALPASSLPKAESLSRSIPYRPVSYMTRGLIYPFVSIGSLFGVSLTAAAADLGFGYYTMDPSETWVFLGEAQYKMALSTVGLFLNVQHTGGTLLTTVQTAADFSTEGGISADAALNLSMPLYVTGSDGVFSFGNTFDCRYSDNDAFSQTSAESEDSDMYIDGFILADSLGAQYEYSKPFGLGVYEELSFRMYAAAVFYAEPQEDNSAAFKSPVIYPAVSVSFGIPHLLPLRNPRGFTVNLPSVLSCSLLTSEVTQNPDDTAKYDQIFCKAVWSSVLYSQEIQKSATKFPLYFNRFTLSAGYTAMFIPDEGIIDYADIGGMFAAVPSMEYRDAVTLEAKLYNALVSGSLGQVMQVFCVSVSYLPYNQKFSYAFATQLDL